MIISEPREEIAKWAGDKIGCTFKPPFSALACVNEANEIQAAAIFNNWSDFDICVSVAAKKVSRQLLMSCASYVFEQLKCTRATLRTRIDNLAAQKALKRIGAQLEGRQTAYFGDCDALVFGILKKDFASGLSNTSNTSRP